MQQSVKIKPQDVALLVKLLAHKKSEPLRQVDIAMSLGLSQGEIAKSLLRLNKAGLVNDRRINRSAVLEFLLHAVKYVFPAEIGALAAGVPTAISSPAHKKMVLQNGDDTYVWPLLKGSARGQSIKPLYPQLAQAALKDADFYDIMSAIEILRMGRSRERKAAEEFLERKIKAT